MTRESRHDAPFDPRALLRELDLAPVLVDVGASGWAPAVWEPIAQASTYIGFDPDARDRPLDTGGRYGRTLIIDRAVVADHAQTAKFYLTRSPHCSSTLPPDRAALAAYTFAPLFDVVSEVTVPAVSLDVALAQSGASGADWVKLDTQGTDLRIFNGLRQEIRARTLAVDVEPGLIDAYQGEDLFVDLHRDMCAQGFWLSRLTVGTAVRGSRAAVEEMRRLDPAVSDGSISRRCRPSPAWFEARYLRTEAAMLQAGLGEREYLLLAIFAMLDGQWVFAFDIVQQFERAFGRRASSQALKDDCIRRLREPTPTRVRALVQRVLPSALRRRIRGVIRALQALTS